jgi:hypothetical protein
MRSKLHLLSILGIFVENSSVFEMVELRHWLALPAKNPLAEPPREHLLGLEGCVSTSRHTEDIVELFRGQNSLLTTKYTDTHLFKRPLLCLRQEEEDQEEGYNIQSSVKAKGASRREGCEDTREGH